MSPTATITEEERVLSARFTRGSDLDTHFRKGEDRVTENGVLTVSEKDYAHAQHPEFLPTWDPRPKYPPLQPFKHDDRGFFGHPEYKRLIPDPSKVDMIDLTPKLGTEFRDGAIQLSRLTPEQKDDLTLLVEKRGIVVFRNQDFKDQGPEFCKKWAQHFGPLNIHPTSGSPAGHPEYHITYRRADPGEHAKVFSSRTSNISWHSDITYELQPPGITVFAMLQCPRGGGDTLFADTIEAYERLSPRFKKIIEGLKVVHTSRDQAYDAASGGGVQRRAPVDAIHPLVRYHPVTGKKSLFVQKFAKEIIGLKKEESDNILEFLYKHIETSLDLQLRARYEPGTVVIWDNRRVNHSATLDWDTPEARHCFRITPTAERPVETKEEYDNWTVEQEKKYMAEVKEMLGY